MKDKYGSEIKIGDNVQVPYPNDTDIHNNEFVGFVDGFRKGYVVVIDGDDEVFEFEPERLEIV